MDADIVATNLRRLRQQQGKSQAEMAELSDVSLSTYRKFETGQAMPRVDTLQSLGNALQVDLKTFLEPVVQLKKVRFRAAKNKKLKSRDHINTEVGRWLRDFWDLEQLLDRVVSCQLPHPTAPAGMSRIEFAKKAAADAREAFKLQDGEPIRDICGLLEDNGVKVYPITVASNDFFGLSVGEEDGGPAVVVNTWDRISVERWIFTAVHELGHLILHLSAYNVDQTEEVKQEELEANHFASYFLMPQETFQKEWDQSRGLHLLDRVYKVKHFFQVSYKTVLYRLSQMKASNENWWLKFQMAYKQCNHKTLLATQEPHALAEDAFKASFPEFRKAKEPSGVNTIGFKEDRLWRLVRDAIERKVISLPRGAEILGLSVEEMRDVSTTWGGRVASESSSSGKAG